VHRELLDFKESMVLQDQSVLKGLWEIQEPKGQQDIQGLKEPQEI
jgi:hypothetical protein